MPYNSEGSMDGFRGELRKEISKMPQTLPSMSEMLRNEAEGYNSSVRISEVYGVDTYHVGKAEEVIGRYTGVQDSNDLLVKRYLEDLDLRSRIKGQQLTVRSKEETEREISFRAKDESYKKKNRDQEKAARERNEQFSDISTEDLEEEAEDLREELAEELSDEDKQDSYTCAYREYQKKYLNVIDDLIKTRNSKGKWYGHYSSHIALAEEKYRFYSEERERLIGREQAKILMERDNYQTELQKKKSEDPAPEFDLTKTASMEFMFQAYNNVSTAGITAIKKAMKEYSECASKIYELKKQIEAIAEVYMAEEGQKKAKSDKFLQDAYLRGQEITDIDQNVIDAMLDTVTPSLHEYLNSLRSEIRVWQFHLDASVICVKHVMESAGEEDRRFFGDHGGMLSAHSAYIREHFGVDIGGLDKEEDLDDQFISERVGVEAIYSDISAFFKNATFRGAPLEYYKRQWDSRKIERKGYWTQEDCERTAAEMASAQVYSSLAKDALKEKQRGETLSESEMSRIMEQCLDMMVLTEALPEIKTVPTRTPGVYIPVMMYSGARNADGVFEPGKYRLLDSSEIAQKKAVYQAHWACLKTIEDPDAEREHVKAAIIAELPLVDEAFSDIDAFMNVGEGREIFTAKSHEDVFTHTAGMPTILRKVRKLRDIISLMLRRDDIVDEAGQEQSRKDLKKDLFYKWLLMNRIIGFIDYRTEIMNMAYDMSISDWLKDSTVVQDFWTGDDFQTKIWGPYDVVYRSRKGKAPVKADKAAKAMADSEEDGREEASERAHADASRIAVQRTGGVKIDDEAVEEQWQASLDDINAEEFDRDARIRDALDGLSMSEKRFLDMDRYEASAFRTRREQKDAIKKDLYKGSKLPSLSVEYNRICIEIAQLSDLQRNQVRSFFRDPGEIDERKAVLSEELDSIRELMDEVNADIEERADKLVLLLRKPETLDQEIDDTITTLQRIVQSPGLDASVDANLKTMVMTAVSTLQQTPADQKKQTVINLMLSLRKTMEKAYLEHANAYADDLIKDLRTNDIPNVKEETAKLLNRILSDVEKKRNSTSIESMEQVVAQIRTSYRKIGPNRINRVKKVPDIMTLFASVNALKNYTESYGKKRTVSFKNTVDVQEPVMSDDHETVTGYNESTVYMSEEEQATEIRKLQKEMSQESEREAVSQAAKDRDRIKAAQNVMDVERIRVTKDMKPLSEAVMNTLFDVPGMKAEEKEFLYNIGCLHFSMADLMQTKGDGLESLPGDLLSEFQKVIRPYLTTVKILKDEHASQEQVTEAARSAVGMINTAFDDIHAFVADEPGSSILKERRPSNFYRLPEEPEEPENFSEDIEGMASLILKTGELKELIEMTQKKQDVLSEEDRTELTRKAGIIDGLFEFLEWRRNALLRSRSFLRIDTNYVSEVRENPERWTHEAFVFLKEE